MTRCRPRIALAGLILAGSLAITGQSRALDVRCQNGELVRDVHVRFAQDADGLPCQVIWQNTIGSDQRELVWRSNSRLGFCTGKARELVHQLIDRGWMCEAEVTASTEHPGPGPTVRLEPAAPGADAALPLRPQPGTDAQLAPSAGGAPKVARQPDPSVLAAALGRDVARLDELAGSPPGSFRASMARLGDLNGDGLDDAVVLLSHRAEGAPPSLHLLAYRFDGATFQPVARLALTETSNAQLQDIANGVIEIVEHVAQPGDPACCPSGQRRRSFVLRDHELVSLPEDHPGT